MSTKKLNPVSKGIYKEMQSASYLSEYNQKPVTKDAVMSSTLLLLAIVVGIASAVIYFGSQNPGIAAIANVVGCLGVIGMGTFTVFNKKAREGSMMYSVIFSIFEGLMAGGFVYSIGSQTIGGVSGWVYTGQAAIATVALFVVVLVAYYTGLVKVNDTFLKITFIGLLAMSAFYVINFILSLAIGFNMLFLGGEFTIISIGIAIVAIVSAIMTLFADLELMEIAINTKQPEKVRWAIATGFMTSIVWLYLEILRLLVLIARRK